MSLENEDRVSQDNASEKLDVVLKGPKISYTRDFMLSLSSLDTCKKLPSGFNESLLSEFGDGLQSIQDRPRIPGSLPLQGFRRTQYGSSPPTHGDSGDFSRGIHGKWESRRSDRDSDSQSDRDSDSGRRFGHQSRGSWQTREEDGLLGSGSFPRPFGYATGISAAKMRANEQYQLSKGNEPYHPPRPYKAVPHARRDTDAYNDETFGSVNCTSEDRAEAERKRRASFEIMRKEQQKAHQEKQKLDLEKHKEGDASELCEVLDDRKKEIELVGNNELDISAGIPIITNDLEKNSFSSHSPASRPLVPPGFKDNMMEMNIGSKSLIRHPLSEVQKSVTEVSLLDAETNLSQNGTKDGLKQQLSQEISLVAEQPAVEIQHSDLLDKQENVNSFTSLDVPILKLGIRDQLPLTSSYLNSDGTLDDLGIVKLDAKVLEGKIVDDFNRTNPTSVLEDFFGTTLSMIDSGSTSAEHHDEKPDNPNFVQSSKFAQWFFEEETKPDDMPTGRPTDLLSIIVSGDKGRYKVSDLEASEHLLPDFSDKTLEQLDRPKFDMHSTANGISNQLCINNNNKETIPTVLTCEDLEQSILSEYSAKDTAVQSFFASWSSSAANTEQQNTCVDGDASLHLLSLLQKGTDKSIHSGVDIDLADKLPGSQENGMNTAGNKPKWEENSNNIPNSVNTLTLEALFGTAFMKELHSVEAPVSAQRGSTGSTQLDTSEPTGLPFPVSDNDISSLTSNKTGLQRPNHDYDVFASNQNQQTKLSEAENWHAFDDAKKDMMSSSYHIEPAMNPIRFQEAAEIQLSEENSICSSDLQNHSRFMSIGNSSKRMNSSLDGHIDTVNKLAAFSDVKDQHLVVGSENLPFTSGPYEQSMSRIPYRSPQMQQSLSQFQTPQMSQVRPLYHHLQSHPAHMSSEMMFLGPEPVFNHDSPAIHQFTSNINVPSFPRPNVRVAGFEVPSHRSILHQQMQLSGNRPPYMLPDFSRGGPVSHHGSQLNAFVQEMNQMQSLPFVPPVPNNIGSRGVSFSDINSLGNPPEAFQRLIEMELRANSKQTQPLAPGRNQGFHGHEAGMGFQYR